MVLALAVVRPSNVSADPDSCAVVGTAATCQGDQSGGVAVDRTPLTGGGVLRSPPVTTINVRALAGAIVPSAESSGIYLHNEAGNDVAVNAGTESVPITIGVSGKETAGILVNGYGTPTPTSSFFGWVLPTGPGGSGGNLNIDSFATITTDGNDAPGISARSRAGGYSQAVIDTLKGFLGTGQSSTFLLGTVQGDAANLNKTVTGSNGGTFKLSNGASGVLPAYTYDLTGMALDTLAAGQHIDTTVTYTVASTVGHAPSQAWLTLRVARLEDGSLTVQPSTYFQEYGRAYEGAATAYVSGTQTGLLSLQPDFDAYMTRLLADSAVGGIGGNVVVVTSGSIVTKRDASLGQGSYGILAQSKGGVGLGGGGGVFSGDTGNAGSAGGAVTVTNSATIHTYGEGAHGIVASSSGGDGGRGGGASFAGNGGAGGAGAKGGAVTVINHGDITTGDIDNKSASAIGILAQSIGGRGGEGGGGGWLGGGGGAGGAGTVNDALLVRNSGTITTYGDDSYGILAQNIGGFGGGGGGAGGIVALGSTGGNAGAGGDASIENSGNVKTSGRNANALMVQSIGGGGGSAGGSGGLVAIGGDGTAGGKGGLATLSNSGELTATGLGARGIVAQSIGGGGGHGGDSGGLVAIGGDGATTSDGGMVSVTNSGKITSASNAILAESIGGGGGVGGSSGGWFGVGGDGGGGGAGGAVDVTNSGDLSTSGRNAAALFAQSVGGGGGNGGNVVAVGAFASVAVGGAGGPGGAGNTVVVKSTGGTIETQGVQSHGIYAQSVGGRGGNGGFAAAIAAGKGLAATLAVGRTGGGGGDGDDVQVESKSTITTHEHDAYGIYAQSVGGGGGTGGFSVAASAAVQGVAVSFSIGGSGGAAGDGGKVDVGKDAAVGGTIATEGDYAHGIVAQSVGGGGGRGGLAVVGNISAGTSGSGSVGLTIGGGGGAGGAGRAVKVNSAAKITTKGEKAYGIKAQSVGGGGGDGGLAVSGAIGGGSGSLKLNVAVGGSGGAGSTGGTVNVDTSGGSIETWGKDGYGIYAQSVGGGGGDGGMAISGTLGLGGKNANLSVTAGGVGGEGSTGDHVTVTNAGTVTTHGEAAFGIFAQSIGGGGGQGGAAFSGNGNLNIGQEGYNVNIGLAFGGAGGSGNRGGVVDVTNTGRIETFGMAAYGIFAESVGGGGGQGGSARTMSINFSALDVGTFGKYAAFNLSLGGSGGSGGDGNTVNVTNSSTILTHGTDSHGIYAQSVGGGGGTGGEGAHGFFGVPTFFLDKTPLYQQVSLSMGGSAGAAGDGKAVNVVQQGDVTAYGEGSYGIFAQSVGGGGGTGGKGVIGFTGTVGIGGTGGASGDGGKVEVTANGNIDTYGGDSYGVFAQSVGGGGGIGGNIDRGLAKYWDIGIGVGIIKNSGNGGSGGETVVTGEGVIHTRGDGSTGIFAQSVGGGGGVAGDQNGWGVAGSAGGNGSGGPITVDWTGRILTEGAGAHGIFAQSAGGEAIDVVVYDQDGNPTATTLARRQNLAKDVRITVHGDVTAKGAGSDAIYAESKGDEGNGNITVKVEDRGTVRGGAGTNSAGVRLVGGLANSVENTGSIGAADGILGLAIVGDTGNDSVTNRGTVTGSVTLGTGNNAFANEVGGIFNAGATVDLGASRLFTNSGSLSPGGSNVAATTTLTGNLTQSGTGGLLLDLSLAGLASDRLDIAGSARTAGKIQVNPIDTGYARPGTQQRVMLSANNGVINEGLRLTAPSSPVVRYELSYPGSNEIAVRSHVDFAPATLGFNARQIGRQVNAIQSAGGSTSFAPYAASLIAQPDNASLNIAYEKLGPGALGSLSALSTTSSLDFQEAMHSCRQREGEHRFIREGECRWLRFGGSFRDQEREDLNPGYTLNTLTIAGGAQREVAEDTHVGFGLSYVRSDLKSLFSDVDGDRFEAGVIVKRRYGATRLSGSLSAGYGRYESRRLVDLATPGLRALGNPELWSASLLGKISHDLVTGDDFYVRPMVGLGITHVVRHAYSESGAGGANLQVERARDTFASLHPAIEFGGERALADGTLLRPYLRLGLTRFLTDNDRHITATLQGAPAGVEPFTVVTRSDRTYADVSVGLDVLTKKGATVRVDYTGQFSGQSSANAVWLKLSIPF